MTTTPDTTTVPVLSYDELLTAITDPDGREVLAPATGELVGRVHESTVEDLEQALVRARGKQPEWAVVPDAERSALLLRAADAVEANAAALAELLSREQGKPVHNGPNALFEVGCAVAWLGSTAAFPLAPETLVEEDRTRAELHYRLRHHGVLLGNRSARPGVETGHRGLGCPAPRRP